MVICAPCGVGDQASFGSFSTKAWGVHPLLGEVTGTYAGAQVVWQPTVNLCKQAAWRYVRAAWKTFPIFGFAPG